MLTAEGSLVSSDVSIEDGIISGLGRPVRGAGEIDATGGFVLPGLIDLHSHGIGTYSVWDESLSGYSTQMASYGATTFFPTFFGPPEQTMDRMCSFMDRSGGRLAPNIGGFRLESPYIAKEGGGKAGDLAAIDRLLTDRMLDAGRGLVRIWDISPEVPGAAEEIRYLCGLGVVCSIAHTEAAIDTARSAVDAGARLVTHLFNTFSVPEMVDMGVYPAGLVDYLLTEDRLVCEIIADGTHVHPLLVDKALRCKSAGRIAFVTDSNYGAGLPAGRHELPGGFGVAVINGSNNGVRLADRGMILAGSALTPIDAFRNAVRIFKQDMATASRLCSTTPALLLGLNKGQIAPGQDADLIILGANLELNGVIAAGRVVYQAN